MQPKEHSLTAATRLDNIELVDNLTGHVKVVHGNNICNTDFFSSNTFAMVGTSFFRIGERNSSS